MMNILNDRSWVPTFYERERKKAADRKAKYRGSFLQRVDLMSWASEENQLHSLAVSQALSAPTRRQTWYMMRPHVRRFAMVRKDACPVCRDAYIHKDGNKYIHREYGDGAYMCHIDE